MARSRTARSAAPHPGWTSKFHRARPRARHREEDGLHKPTFHDGGLHAPMEAGGMTYESEFITGVWAILSGKNAEEAALVGFSVPPSA